MAVVNKRIFDTDNALKGSFNGLCGRWQILTYAAFVFSYSLVIGWINKLHDYTILMPSTVQCDYSKNLTNKLYTNHSIIQRLSGKSMHSIYRNNSNETDPIKYIYSNEYGNTIPVYFGIICDLKSYIKAPRYSHYLGYIIGCLVLGFASDRGGRKMIILACIWTTGIMCLFQLVGHDFISYVFFQFFIGLFIGGVQASFLPAIIEMFPINFRAFYGVFFHLIVCIFELFMPLLAKSFFSWRTLQIFVTVPIILTAVLYYFVYESIFWFLAYKEYDKAIQVLTKLAKRNGILFESKFKQAKDFLHAKHSKATQVDILPLLRLQDLEVIGKKYPQVDMAELQKQKSNSSKIRRFLNSLKGASYRSTNTIYRPFDFIYSPTLLVYVLILAGLWFTNGLTDSMESIKKSNPSDFYVNSIFSVLACLCAALVAIILAIFKFSRRWLIFMAYLSIETCLLSLLIANPNSNGQSDQETRITLSVLYHLCKFSSYFGYIFLMLITAELFPTSLRCSGMGFCFMFKLLGSAISSPKLMNYNSNGAIILYCILTLFFSAMTLFLPETKTFPLPRSILQIEAMPTRIGKRLRSRKVKNACERRQNLLSDTVNQGNQYNIKNSAEGVFELNGNHPKKSIGNIKHNDAFNQTAGNQSHLSTKGLLCKSSHVDTHSVSDDDHQAFPGTYDTVTSVHDIEQDDHIYYAEKKDTSHQPLLSFERRLTKIVEVPSKNITRNNSVADDIEYGNSRV